MAMAWPWGALVAGGRSELSAPNQQRPNRNPIPNPNWGAVDLGRTVWDSLVFSFPLAPMLTFTSAVGKLKCSDVMASSHVVASHITKILSSFRQILQFCFRENRHGRIPP